ncbi:hypothetical protein Tco_1007176 [Tanacetum coccineum]
MNDEDQIIFLGTKDDDMDQCVEELADSKLHSMSDDEVVSISGFGTNDSNEKGTEYTEPKVILTQSEEAIADNIIDEMADLKASTDYKLEESVPKMIVDALEERMPEVQETLQTTVPGLISKPLNKELNALNILESRVEKDSEEKVLEEEPPFKRLKFLIPNPITSSPNPLNTILPQNISLDQFTDSLLKTTSSEYSLTPPRDESKGKGCNRRKSNEVSYSFHGRRRISSTIAKSQSIQHL